MAQIEGLERLNAKLRAMVAAQTKGGQPRVAVGYTAAYALYVHENMEMKLKGRPRPGGRGRYWDPQGRAQPKFLEQPARELRPVLVRIVIEQLTQGRTLAQALLVAGLRLQRESQQLVPVDTGNLKNSAFTRLESGEAGGAAGPEPGQGGE